MAPPRKPSGIINARTLTAPLAALVMAGLLYTYSVTSIRAAKLNAQRHREADGGQLDMRRESLRRHGVLEQVKGTRDMELLVDARDFKGGEEFGGNTAIKIGEESKVRSKTEAALAGLKKGQ